MSVAALVDAWRQSGGGSPEFARAKTSALSQGPAAASGPAQVIDAWNRCRSGAISRAQFDAVKRRVLGTGQPDSAAERLIAAWKAHGAGGASLQEFLDVKRAVLGDLSGGTAGSTAGMLTDLHTLVATGVLGQGDAAHAARKITAEVTAPAGPRRADAPDASPERTARRLRNVVTATQTNVPEEVEMSPLRGRSEFAASPERTLRRLRREVTATQSNTPEAVEMSPPRERPASELTQRRLKREVSATMSNTPDTVELSPPRVRQCDAHLPVTLEISGTDHAWCGIYEMQRSERGPVFVNNCPVWRSSCGYWLYSTPMGYWRITDRESDFATGVGVVISSEPHRRAPPDATKSWLLAGQVADARVRVIGVGTGSVPVSGPGAPDDRSVWSPARATRAAKRLATANTATHSNTPECVELSPASSPRGL
eukprot:TRINITY_DN35523_c0_g1_i1.p1 TRINITY_DN35523_c0_g1~~TRINITY_DN35523_c0_g1_i1.p1  ORF type:complete len:449 (+),score=129.44 TRINITY_DN35523_c0_g1_i1:71-1348(+)